LGCAIVLAVPGAKAGWLALRPTGLAILALMSIANIAVATEGHFSQTPFLPEAQRVAAVVRPGDLLITEWDDVSLLYGSFLAKGVNIFYVPTEASAHGARTLRRLSAIIAGTERSGRQVYFLAVLDTPEPAWKAFLGDRCGLPYHSFDTYRNCAEVVEKLRVRNSAITLRQLPKSEACSQQPVSSSR
jgi:hypothetical protein